jgi:general stress protein YciG
MPEKKTGKKGDMTVEEAGQKGGERTAETHGKEFYEKIGHKGGEETAKTHGHEFYQEIGHKGGEKGGQKVKRLIEEGKEAEEKK